MSQVDKVEFGNSVPPNIKTEIYSLGKAVGAKWWADLIKEIQFYNIKSPIEQLFFASWKFLEVDREFTLIPQFQVGDFRVDFKVHSNKFSVPFVIELDGHEFHEKTKDQVDSDKKRERALVKEGFTVLRYSGREVMENAVEAALNAYQIISKGVYGDA